MRRFIGRSCPCLVAVVAGPVAAAKPATFSTDLWIEGQDSLAAGSYKGGFFIPTTGNPGLMALDVVNTVADPLIPDDTRYPFVLKASDTQKAALAAYFNAKWSCLTTSDVTLLAYCDQMARQIAGTARSSSFSAATRWRTAR